MKLLPDQKPPLPPEAEVANRRKAMGSLSRTGQRFFELIEFDGDEALVCEIRKHPIGLFYMYLVGGFFGLLIITGMVYVATMPSMQSDIDISAYKLPVIAVLLLLLIGDVIITFLSAIMYKSNVIYVTDEKIAQVQYRTIIDRKISQLSIGDVQDVSVRQDGLLARMFHYGTMVIETAGEQQNYTFTFVPYPYECARHIVGAHERNIARYGN